MATVVKICGLRTAEHALAAVDAGADLLGFIFAPARRQIRPEDAAMIATLARERATETQRRIHLVGIFVNESPERMLDVARLCGLDVLQLSGDDDVRVLDVLPSTQQIFKAIRFTNTPNEQSWIARAEEPRLRLHAEAHVAGVYGGAGVRADWEQSAALARNHAILLAGGLNPDNVAEAIRRVRPWGVDVSSGVERDGVKDNEIIRAFVRAVRSIEQEQGN